MVRCELLSRVGDRLGLALLLAALLGAGCSGGSSTNPGDGDDNPLGTGQYELLGYFGGDVAPGGFGLYVTRLDPACASAKGAQVELNGAEVGLREVVSTDEDAFYSILSLEYESGIQYQIDVGLGDRSAACAFTGLAYPQVTITAPESDATFVPGESIEVTWSYDEGTPSAIYVAAGQDADPMAVSVELPGTTTSYTIPGSITSTWTDQNDAVLITVDEGEAFYPFTGDLAGVGSGVATVGWGDAALVYAGEPEPEVEWTVTVTLSSSVLPADGASNTLVDVYITDDQGRPPSSTEAVTFSLNPSSRASLLQTECACQGGYAWNYVTAGQEAGTVEVSASFDGDSGQATLTLQEAIHTITVGSGGYPTIDWDPDLPIYGLLIHETHGMLAIKWTIAASGLAGFAPPVTYGTKPSGTTQVYPLLNAAPAALEAGTSYRIGLVDAQMDTTYHTFTH